MIRALTCLLIMVFLLVACVCKQAPPAEDVIPQVEIIPRTEAEPPPVKLGPGLTTNGDDESDTGDRPYITCQYVGEDPHPQCRVLCEGRMIEGRECPKPPVDLPTS